MSIKAETIAKALGGRKSGAGWMAPCPGHDDREPSLSICDAEDGKVLVCCHAGCVQQRVIANLRSRGLWMEKSPRPILGPTRRGGGEHRPSQVDAKRSEAALAIWQHTMPPERTRLEAYLASRRLFIAPPPTLRFHGALKHPSGGTWPAMVALVTRGYDDTPLAIHRTFLAHDGSGKAPVDPQKMMLGPCRGGAVRLAEPGNVLMVGEGIETCLAAMRASGHPAWAALSTSGLRALDLPKDVRDVIVLADGDDPGEAAAQECARRWTWEGRRVRIARPPQGMDFNDLLKARLASIEEEAR